MDVLVSVFDKEGFWKVSEENLEKISSVSDDYDVVFVESEEGCRREIADAEILYAIHVSKESAALTSNLKWIQSTFAGVDGFHHPEITERDIVLTTASGSHRVQTPEHIIGTMIALAHQFYRCYENQLRREWAKDQVAPLIDEIYGKTIGILGLGNVGKPTARRAKAMGMRVVAVKRDVSEGDENVDELYPLDQFMEVVRQADFLVLTLPLIPETEGMIDENVLKEMKRSAFLINVARGSIVHKPSFVKALKHKWIRGASLDVFEVEPLDSDDEYYSLDNVIITPHSAGVSPHFMDRSVDIFCQNLERFSQGRELLNVVDKTRGY